MTERVVTLIIDEGGCDNTAAVIADLSAKLQYIGHDEPFRYMACVTQATALRFYAVLRNDTWSAYTVRSVPAACIFGLNHSLVERELVSYFGGA